MDLLGLGEGRGRGELGGYKMTNLLILSPLLSSSSSLLLFSPLLSSSLLFSPLLSSSSLLFLSSPLLTLSSLPTIQYTLDNLQDQVVQQLMLLASDRNDDKFLSCLHKIQLGYPKITERQLIGTISLPQITELSTQELSAATGELGVSGQKHFEYGFLSRRRSVFSWQLAHTKWLLLVPSQLVVAESAPVLALRSHA